MAEHRPTGKLFEAYIGGTAAITSTLAYASIVSLLDEMGWEMGPAKTFWGVGLMMTTGVFVLLWFLQRRQNNLRQEQLKLDEEVPG